MILLESDNDNWKLIMTSAHSCQDVGNKYPFLITEFLE